MTRQFTCRGCGNVYDSIREGEFVNVNGLSERTKHDGPPLCPDCATAWSTRQRTGDLGRDPEADFRQFQQERHPS